MSLIHKYLVGHFDLFAFFQAPPAVLKPIDADRARRLLESIGSSLTEKQIAQAFHFGDGFVECVWSALGHRLGVAWEFARNLADVESCLVVESPGGKIYPAEVELPWNHRDGSLTAESAERILAKDDIVELRRALSCAAMCDKGSPWAPSFCGRLAGHEHFNVRGNAMYAFGLLAHRGHDLERSNVQPLIELGLVDSHPYVRRQAVSAARALESSSGWLFPYFDNAIPEMEAPADANGWILCPTCGWRFATYDPSAFREGRCMTCRQRLRANPVDACATPRQRRDKRSGGG